MQRSFLAFIVLKLNFLLPAVTQPQHITFRMKGSHDGWTMARVISDHAIRSHDFESTNRRRTAALTT